jgi:predicted transcriptional regulator
LKHATLRQLKVFASVARHLSFARAAEELHLTQPAVSGQIRKLEEHAGVALFEQLGKKTHLTAAGADLLGIVRSIIEQFEVAEHAMTQHKGVSGGRPQRRRDQRGRLLPAAPAGRVHRPPPGRDAQLHGAQPRRACSPTSPPTSPTSRSWRGRPTTPTWSASRSRRIPTSSSPRRRTRSRARRGSR